MGRGDRGGLLRALAAIAIAALALVGSASAADVGANDDTGKYAADAGSAFYTEMATLGLRQAVVTVRWQPSDPLALAERPLLDLTVAAARRAGLGVVFATYPYPPREIESGLARPDAYAAWLTELAHRYPEVRGFVVGNEPNQPAFWRPQFSRARQRSASAFGPYLAAGYDAIKAVDPTLTVVGVGLSPRGNDRPLARSNVSTSPVRFLAALGRWYGSSGRQRPLMDGLSFHPYPNTARDPLARGYPWPNAGFVNLDRVKQAVWDAFHGTKQPTTLAGLRLYLDEVGWQVDTSGLDGYTGSENVVVATELHQASVYGELVRRAACDPDVAQVNIFGFRDDTARARVPGSPAPRRRDAEALGRRGPVGTRRAAGLRRVGVAARAVGRGCEEAANRPRRRSDGRPAGRRGSGCARMPAAGQPNAPVGTAGAGLADVERRSLRVRVGRPEPDYHASASATARRPHARRPPRRGGERRPDDDCDPAPSRTVT